LPIRAANSVLPSSQDMCCWLSVFSRSSWRRWSSSVTPGAGARLRIGSSLALSTVPWYAAGMNPLPQFCAPEYGAPFTRQTKPGMFWFGEPRP
jgi:hypothetical protein